MKKFEQVLKEAKDPEKKTINGIATVLFTTEGPIKDLEKDLKNAGVKALGKGNDGFASGFYIAKKDGPKVAGKDAARFL